jgi:FKBP-type peptidyl-prolyl cis-trans isomerase
MKTFTAFLSVLFCTVVLAEEPATQPATQPTTLPAHVSDASYGIGFDIGKQMKSTPVKLDTERLMQGLRDSLGGKESQVSEEAIRAAMMTLQQEAMAAQQAADKVEGDKNAAAGTTFRADNAKKEGVTTTASGLQIQTLKAGTGESPKASDTVKVHYTGTLVDGTKFDSSVDRGRPATFQVGGVIKGWTEGLQQMKVGGKSRLVVPPELGYGPAGTGPIPPNATLVFEVELLEIVKQPPTP